MYIQKFILIMCVVLLAGCAPKRINAVVDTLIIEDPVKYEQERKYCSDLALTYDLTAEKIAKGAYGGAIAGSTVAGIALIAGQGFLNPVAIPFIAGASLLGAGVGAMSTEEREARENILMQCLAKHGYTVYSPR